jgi:hypothetical protein
MPAPAPVHTVAASHARPVQQAWPAPPQSRQTPPTQAPVVQAVPQQADPRAPHPAIMPSVLSVPPSTLIPIVVWPQLNENETNANNKVKSRGAIRMMRSSCVAVVKWGPSHGARAARSVENCR